MRRSADRRMGKKDVVYLYNRILLSLKNGWDLAVYEKDIPTVYYAK